MPMVAAAATAFFVSAATAVSAAVGGFAAAALGGSIGAIAIGGAISNIVYAGVMMLPQLAATAALTAAMTPKAPKPQSTGVQVNLKADPRSPVPFVFGHTAVGPTLVYRATSGAKNVRLSMVGVTSAAGPVEDACVNLYADNYRLVLNGDPETGLKEVTSLDPTTAGSKLFKGNFRVCVVPGGTQPDVTSLAPPIYTGTAMPNLDASSKLSGLAHVTYHFDYLQESFPGGVPGKLLIEMKGIRCYDPRQDSTYPGGSGSQRLADPNTWAFTENPYIIGLNWTLGFFTSGKKLGGIGAKWAEIDVPAFVTGANIADANGWKCAGQVSSADNKFSVLATILQAGSGKPVTRGAQISCITDAPRTTIYTITTNDVIGSAEVVNSTSWRDRKNTVVPHYREPSQWWEMIAGQSVSAPIYVEEDGNETRTIEIEYPMVQSAAQAKQLATYDLVNNREFLSMTVTCGPRLLEVRVGEAVKVELPEIAVHDEKFIVVSRRFDPLTHQVTLQLRSETDDKHPFALGQTAVAPGSPTQDGGYDPSNPPPPSANVWQIVATHLVGTDGVSQPAIVIEGACDDPNAQSIVVEYRLNGTEAWTSYAELPKSTTRIEITGLTGGDTYQAALSYRTVTGVVGQRAILGPVTVGQNALPWDVLTNLPPVIANTVTNGNFAAQYVTWWNGINNQTVQDYLETVQDTNSTHANAIQSLDSMLANATAEIATARNGELTLANRFGSLTTTFNDALAEKASTTTVSGLSSEITSARGEFPTLSAKIGTVSGTIADALNGKASASVVNTLQSTVNDHTSSITELMEVQNGLDSKYVLQLNGSGGITGVQIASGGGEQSFKVVSSNFSIVDPTGSAATVPFAYTGGQLYLGGNVLVPGNLLSTGTIQTAQITVGSSGRIILDAPNNRILIFD